LPASVIILISLSVVFGFLNGFHDSSNIVATIIFSRALQPRVALGLTAIAEFCGPFIFGVAVAKTIGEDIVAPGSITTEVIIAALASAILWNLITWFLGIPSSSSHALVGGIIGAVCIGVDYRVIRITGLAKVIIALLTSPVLGFIVGYIFTRLVFFLARNASQKINWFFKRAQVITGIGLALSHGANDAQKTMGIMAMGLVSAGILDHFYVPEWVILLGGVSISLGTALGGWRLIKTLGGRFFKIRPVHGFASQISSAGVILGAALLGGPVSTTQVVSSAILGVGSADRINKVRWGVAGNIVTAWFLTIPFSALLAAGIYWLIVRAF